MSTNTGAQKSNGIEPKLLIHIVVTVLLMFFFRFLPAPAPITPYGMAIIGIFFGLVYAWTMSSLIWPSLLSLAALGVTTEFGNTATAYVQAFGNENLILMLLSFIMFGTLIEEGVSDWISVKLVTMKLTKGKPWVLVAFTFYAIAILSCMMNGTILIIFLLTIFTDLFKKFGYQIGERFPVMFIVGMMLSTGLGCSILPFKGWPLAPLGTVKKAGMVIDDGRYILLVLSFIFLTLAAYILLMKVMKCDVSRLANADFTALEESIKGGMTKRQKAIALCVVAYVVLCIAFSFLGGKEGIRAVISASGVYGVMLFIIIFMIVYKADGAPLLKVETAARQISWDMIFLYAAAMLVSGLLTSDATGVAPFVMKVLMPIFNSTGEFMFLVLIAVLTLVLTNIGNNLVVVFTMLSVVTMMMNQGVAFNGQVAAIIITATGLLGFVLPASSIYGAMIHSAEMTTSKTSILYGTVALILCVVMSIVYLIPVGQLLF